MTQIAEDLRASEPADALDPALRAKILGSVADVPGTGSAGLVGSESASGTTDKPINSSSVAERLPFGSSPALPVPGSQKRPALAWAYAGAALVAWFLFFPLFQHARQADSFGGQALRHTVKPEAAPVSVTPGPTAPLPPKSVQFQVRLSDREAGKDKNGNADGNVSLQIKDPNSKYRDVPVVAPKPYVAGDIIHVQNALGTPDAPQRRVHKEASIGVQVPNPEITSDRVAEMVKETGGFVAGNTLSTGDDGLKSAELTVKVPVTQFDTFLGQVARLGNVQSKNITGEDVTEKTSDADQTESVLEEDVQKSEARLKALGSRAKWHDEQATRDLRIQLAESRARLVLLKRMAALSTITVDLSQTPKPPAPALVTGGFLHGLKASTHDALQSLVSSASALVALVIWLLAYAPLWIPALLVGRYALREYRKRQAV